MRAPAVEGLPVLQHWTKMQHKDMTKRKGAGVTVLVLCVFTFTVVPVWFLILRNTRTLREMWGHLKAFFWVGTGVDDGQNKHDDSKNSVLLRNDDQMTIKPR